MGLADNRIPEDKLPQCWSDDVRMNALFAPFRLKSANPESWEMKMKFWSDMLRQWCRHKKDPILSASDARVAFQRKGRTPACIEIVVEECFRNGDLSPISKYIQILHNGPESWIRWGARLAFKPAALAFTAVSFLMPAKQAMDNDGLPKASIDATQRFVLESVVQEQATELIQNFPPGEERIGTIEELMRSCDWQPTQRETFEILLGWLVSQGAAVKKGDVVKLADSAASKASPVSESDAALVRLVSAEQRLTRDATRLSRDADQAQNDARVAAQLGNRLAAKNHLRRKHKLQQRAQKCEAALENVRQLLQSMREMEVTAAVVDTYKMSAQAMKQGMKEGGMDEDSVHDTMDDLKEVLENYNEVEKALANSVDDFDAAELEDELRDILSGPGVPPGGTPQREDRGKPAVKLPSPPVESPKIRKEVDRDFAFDGEEHLLAELNELSVDDSSPRGSGPKATSPRGDAGPRGEGAPRVKTPLKTEKVAVAESWTPPRIPKVSEPKPKPSKPWYPHVEQFGLDNSLEQLCDGFGELRTDQRLHPGQKLDVDFSTASPLYNTDFQVRDHKLNDGVWLFNSKDDNHNLANSTEYFSSESPGKAGGSFQMAPGGERRPSSSPWQPEDPATEDLQKRLDNLRRFNL